MYVIPNDFDGTRPVLGVYLSWFVILVIDGYDYMIFVLD
jgi:hypothetical protein